MASLLDITELRDLPVDANGRTILCARLPAIAQQQVNYAGGETDSAALNSSTHFVRVHTDTACRIAVGDSPTAGATSLRLAAGQTEFFAVPPGCKISVVAA